MRQSTAEQFGTAVIAIAPAAAAFGMSQPIGFAVLIITAVIVELIASFQGFEADPESVIPVIDFISDEEAEADREALKAAAFDHMTAQLTPAQLDRLLELWLCGSEGSEIDPAFAFGDWQLQTRGLVDLVSDRVIVVTKIGEGVLIHARYILPPENRPGRDTPAARAIFAPYPRRVSR